MLQLKYNVNLLFMQIFRFTSHKDVLSVPSYIPVLCYVTGIIRWYKTQFVFSHCSLYTWEYNVLINLLIHAFIHYILLFLKVLIQIPIIWLILIFLTVWCSIKTSKQLKHSTKNERDVHYVTGLVRRKSTRLVRGKDNTSTLNIWRRTFGPRHSGKN